MHTTHPTRHLGAPLAEADLAVVLVHGRGASAESILGLADEIAPPGVAIAYLAPQADGHTWYPYSFLAPLASNQPYLGGALGALEGVLALAEAEGVTRERIVLGGFSQGACLALEFAARHPARWGGVFGLSGGLIGPEGTPRDYAGGFEGTPVFLGCSDVDAHIPLWRVEETAGVLERMGARVDARVYPGMAHAINDDETGAVRVLLSGAAQA